MNPVRWSPKDGVHAPPRRSHPPARRGVAMRALALAWAVGLPALAVAQTPCTPPPAVPDSLLRQKTPWTSMQEFIDKNASFTAADTRQITPCSQGVGKPCEPMTAQISAETQAYCLTANLISGKENYLLGMVQRISGSAYKQLGFDRTENVNGLLYLLVSNGKGIAVYQQPDGTVGLKRNQSPYTGWRFQFGSEPDSSFTSSRAQWRRASQNLHGGGMAMEFRRTAAVRSGPADLLPDDADEAQMGAPDFGWMTCAAGCCQFHGTPPGGGNGDGEGHPGPGHGGPGHGGPGHGGHGGHGGRPRMNVAKDRP